MKGVVPGTVFYLIRERGFCYYTHVCTGIISLEVGAPQDLARTKGFDFGLVLCLEDQERPNEHYRRHHYHYQYHQVRVQQ